MRHARVATDRSKWKEFVGSNGKIEGINMGMGRWTGASAAISVRWWCHGKLVTCLFSFCERARQGILKRRWSLTVLVAIVWLWIDRGFISVDLITPHMRSLMAAAGRVLPCVCCASTILQQSTATYYLFFLSGKKLTAILVFSMNI
jgi:hypothetical protein